MRGPGLAIVGMLAIACLLVALGMVLLLTTVPSVHG
jgi:hypothetical protein